MIMTSTETWVGGALRRVANAVTIAELHGSRNLELELMTKANLEQAIQHAVSYGFSVEAVAEAAKMTEDEVLRIADGSAAA